MIPYFAIHMHRSRQAREDMSAQKRADEEDAFYHAYTPPIWLRIWNWWRAR
ncbi:hypothetical protein [Roseibium polysiphoniae]|uniref:Uncharacterized protein n=1 Tax=Roseibium polysiphoniae TaxID=2571221 RepID=A0ABR9C7P5_9HYPH|nr:hypothetical protein [Roseibium polysiphoniae]MBD8875924.1 hypothetical protein [Roseibium polysiphoniae]